MVGQRVVGERAAGDDVGAHVEPPFGSKWLSLTRDELLAAVDVVGRAGERRVGHDVHGERGDVGRSDDASDRQRRAELLAALVELVAEQRRRQRRVDEPGGDEVDADRRELEREVRGQRGQRGRDAAMNASPAPGGGRRCRP